MVMNIINDSIIIINFMTFGIEFDSLKVQWYGWESNTPLYNDYYNSMIDKNICFTQISDRSEISNFLILIYPALVNNRINNFNFIRKF